MNLRNPEATLISATVTQHISPGYADPGNGIGAVFSHAWACWYSASQQSRTRQAFPRVRWEQMPDPPWADLSAGPTQALPSPGQQPGEMVAVFFSLLINAMEGSSLCCSPGASPRVWLPLWQHKEQGSSHGLILLFPWNKPHGLLNLRITVTAAPAPCDCTHSDLDQALYKLVLHPREVSKQYSHLQTESTHPFLGLGSGRSLVCVQFHSEHIRGYPRAVPSPSHRPTRGHRAFPSAPFLSPECWLCFFQKHDFGRTAVSKVVS